MGLDTLQDVLCAVKGRIDQVLIDAGSNVPVEWRSGVQHGIDTFNGVIKAAFLLQVFDNHLYQGIAEGVDCISTFCSE